MYEKLVRIIIFIAIVGIIGCNTPENGTKWNKQGKEYYSKRQYEKAKEYFQKGQLMSLMLAWLEFKIQVLALIKRSL